MDLLDALCGQQRAKSVVDLSLEEPFRRHDTVIFKAIAAYQPQEEALAQLAEPYLPTPKKRSFWLLGVDATPQPRPYARTLAERGFVYQPPVITNNKPITIGHQYSTVALLAENDPRNSRAVGRPPLLSAGCARAKQGPMVGAEQIEMLLADPTLPFHGQLVVEVADSDYARPAYIAAHRKHPNLVTVVRVRGNRVFYRQAERSAAETGGAPAHLRDAQTWHPPDGTLEFPFTSRRGKTYTVDIRAWYNMLVRGKNKPKRLRMHKYPFTLCTSCCWCERLTGLRARPLADCR